MKNFSKIVPIIFVIFVSYFSIKPLFMAGFFTMHDDTQVARVFEMSKALGDGIFPVRWVPDLGYGYGYPLFNFYAPFAYYIGAILTLIGFNALIATKIMLGIAIVFSGIFMYLFAKEFWGKAGAIIAAVLYIYAPYHALDIYVRGDFAEVFAYAFIPLVFWALWKTYQNRTWKYVVVGSIGYACVILSHNLTAMMVTPFVFLIAFLLYIYARREEKLHKPYYPFLILLIGILLSAFYWLPVFPEMRYTNILSQVGGGADFKDHFVCLRQLWDSPWGFGGSTNSCIDGLSYKIGKIHILLALFSLAALVIFWKKNTKYFNIILFFISSLLLTLFLMVQSSQVIWDSIPQMAFFQYPWRFLLLASFFISFLGGASIWFINSFISFRLLRYFVIIIFSFAIIYFNLEVFAPQVYLHKTVLDYTEKDAIRWQASTLTHEYLPQNFVIPQKKTELPQSKIAPNKNIIVSGIRQKTQEMTAEIQVKNKTQMIINQAYFPGWHVAVDGKQSDFGYFNRGLIIQLSPGKHLLRIWFSQTAIEEAANIVSLTGFIIIVLGIITLKKESKHAKKAT